MSNNNFWKVLALSKDGGSLEPLSNPANENQIAQGYEAYNDSGTKIIGLLPPTPEVISNKEINFYDYDGTLLHSYTLSELPLSSLPSAPTHAGLTFQEWNWSLTDINALTSPMDIVATYITDAGQRTTLINSTLHHIRFTKPHHCFLVPFLISETLLQ